MTGGPRVIVAGLRLRDLAGSAGRPCTADSWPPALTGFPDAGPVACDDGDPVALYRAGLSTPAIADRLGCSPSTIYQRLDAAGVARLPGTPAVSPQT
jgi:hypothetical protein